MDYEKMLDRAYEKMPKKKKTDERFEVPKLKAEIQGTRTVIRNFEKTIKDLHRNVKHAFKFITGEAGTSGSIEGQNVILNGKFSPDSVQKIFEEYVNKYVICKECGKPDTKIIEQNSVKMLKCDACGALSPIKE